MIHWSIGMFSVMVLPHCNYEQTHETAQAREEYDCKGLYSVEMKVWVTPPDKPPKQWRGEWTMEERMIVSYISRANCHNQAVTHILMISLL
jgi:hypothetical protein